jgi:hypothetical protein
VPADRRLLNLISLWLIISSERQYEIEDFLSHLGVSHSGESAAQMKCFARERSVGALALWYVLSGIAAAPHSGGSLEEVRGSDLEKIGELLQATGADPIKPLLVLLDLLEAEVYCAAHLALAHAHDEPAHPHSGSNIGVDWVWHFQRPMADTRIRESPLVNSRYTRNWRKRNRA